MRSFTILVLLATLLVRWSFAQDTPILQTYSMEDGLPSDWIRDAVQDQYGFMWFAIFEGLTRFDGYTFKEFPYSNQDSSSIDSDRVNGLTIDNEGHLWISRYFWPLEKFDPVTETSTSFPSHSNSLPNDMISDIFYDPPDYIWLGHADYGGISRLNKASGEIVNYKIQIDSLKSSLILDIHKDPAGNMWLATDIGLFTRTLQDTEGLSTFTSLGCLN